MGWCLSTFGSAWTSALLRAHGLVVVPGEKCHQSLSEFFILLPGFVLFLVQLLSGVQVHRTAGDW